MNGNESLTAKESSRQTGLTAKESWNECQGIFAFFFDLYLTRSGIAFSVNEHVTIKLLNSYICV